jgi:uncharacterized protein YwgA
MNKIERIERIEKCIDIIGGEIVGRKKLHKLIYLLQAKGIDFGQDFIFHFYGVYSPTLSVDLHIAEDLGILIEETSGPAFKIQLKEENGSGEAKCGSGTEKELVKFLADQPASVLEVLSTMVYLHQEGFDGERLSAKLNELKKHLEGHFPKAKELAKELYDIKLS